MAIRNAYNTRRKSSDQLKRELVGSQRHQILKDIIKELTIKKGEAPKQHWMLVGPRGIGKSHLLTLLYYLTQEKGLKDIWLTVLFPEELRMANDLTKFLERTLREVLIELEFERNPIAEQLRKEINDIKKVAAKDRIDYIFNLLNWICAETQKHILLIVENLQQLLGKKIPVVEQKKLRAFLQTYDSVLLIGSATTIFDALHDHSHPFYHFFYIKRLNDLKYEELKQLIINILSEEKNPNLIDVVHKNDARIKALFTFTGGNPRMAVFLSEILKTQNPTEMLELMDGILDELNPYFESILADIPDFMEDILNTMASNEPAQSPKEIAAQLSMPQATIRNYLKQMKEMGYIRLAFSQGRSNYYCINEYLYRIWFQMRDSSHREETRWLMELLMILFSPSEMIQEHNICQSKEQNDFYSQLIHKTAEYVSKNPKSLQMIESCINSIETCEKEERLLKQAKKERTEGKYDQALESYYKIINVNKQSVGALLGVGICLMNMNRAAEAIEKFKEVIKIRPNHSYAYWGWGSCLRSMAKYDEAIEIFKKMSQIEPGEPAVYGSWADCLKLKGCYQEAEEQYKKAIEVDPEYGDGYMSWGDNLYHQKHFLESAEKFKIAMEIDPDSNAIFGLIQNLLQLKQYEEAVSIIEKNFASKPNNARFYLMWGDCLRSMEKYEEAIEKFEKSSILEPNEPAAYGAWADCLRDQELYQEADEKYQKAIEVGPRYVDAYRCWGRNLYLQKKYDKALEKYLKVLELQPKLEGSIVNVVDCLIRLKKYDEALVMCNQLLDTNQNSQGGIAGLIQVYSKMERHTEVVNLAEIARINIASDCSSNLLLGKSFFAIGQYKEALAHFDKVKSIHSDCESVNILRGLTLAYLGETEEALLLIFKELATSNKKVQVDVDYWEECFEVLPDTLKKLNAKMYITSFYNNETEARYTQVQICFFLILLDKYDIVTEYFQHMECEYNTPPPENLVAEEVTPFELLIFSIKFNIVWKLIENKLFEALKLCEIYINYLNNIKDEEAQNKELLGLVLLIFKMQKRTKIESNNVNKVLEYFSNSKVSFNDVFFSIEKCLSMPDSLEAKRYMSDQAIEKIVSLILENDEEPCQPFGKTGEGRRDKPDQRPIHAPKGGFPL